MPRGKREANFPTLWQLEAFRAAARAANWDDAIEALGLTSKHEVIRTIDRLQEHLGLRRGLLLDRENRPYVPDDLSRLVAEVESALEHWQAARDSVSGFENSFYIRLDGYWSHVENFAAHSIVDFQLPGESGNSKVTIELVPGFGMKRDSGGIGMMKDLQGPNPRVDAIIAPADHSNEIEGLNSLALYRWVLLAAIRQGHPIEAKMVNRTFELDALEPYPLAASPRGHRSRDLISEQQSPSLIFDIRFVSDEPAALLALGQSGNVIPIIASDTKMPVGPWLGVKSMRLDRTTSLPKSWAAIRKEPDKVFGGAYHFFWRDDRAVNGEESEEASVIRRFGEQLQRDAIHLDALIEPWDAIVPKLQN